MGFRLKIKGPRRGAQLEVLRETARFVVVDGVRQTHLSLSPDRVLKQTDEISRILKQEGAFLAQMRKLAWGLHFSHTSVIGRAGRVALRPLDDLAMRGGGKLDTRPKWAL